jgi:type III secretion protein Q
MSATKLFLQSATLEEISCRNVLIGQRRRLEAAIDGRTYAWEFQREVPAFYPGNAVRFHLGQHVGWVWTEIGEGQVPVAGLPASELLDLEPGLQLAFMEAVCAPFFGYLESKFGILAGLEGTDDARPILPPGKLLAFSVYESGKPWIRGQLGGEEPLFQALGLFFAQVPLTGSEAFVSIPALVRLEVGRTLLSLQDFEALDLHDAVLLDDTQPAVAVADRLRYSARIEHPHIILGEIMSTPAQAAESSGRIQDIPVRLVFEVGQLEIPFGELQQLRPGYTFTLGSPVEAPVTILANGKAIGSGELLDINGRLGVRVTELSV